MTSTQISAPDVKQTKLADLLWDNHQFFSGFGSASLSTADCGWLVIERRSDADGKVTQRVYHRDAMSRAFQRSVEAGGGARGLCTDSLLDGEYRTLPAGASTVGDAMQTAKGLR